MKKILLFFCMAFAMLMPAQADNYFTMGENDSIRIRPSDIGGTRIVPMYAHFDARVDAWNINMTYPSGMEYAAKLDGPGTDIPYINHFGRDSIYHATISVANNGTSFSSVIYEFGYWDHNGDGIYDSYGTVKWEAGDYLMTYLNFSIYPPLPNTGTITIQGIISSTDDWRGGTVGQVVFYRQIDVWVGYRKGDVNGDEVLTITDVNMLINYVVNETGLNSQYQIDAADVNGDGEINLTDVTILTNMVVNGINEVTQEQ